MEQQQRLGLLFRAAWVAWMAAWVAWVAAWAAAWAGLAHITVGGWRRERQLHIRDHSRAHFFPALMAMSPIMTNCSSMRFRPRRGSAFACSGDG